MLGGSVKNCETANKVYTYTSVMANKILVEERNYSANSGKVTCTSM